MEITIQSVNFETSESLNAYITKKLGKMNRFTEIKLHVGDELFYASKIAEKFEDAASQAIEALERQVIKAKEKRH